MTIDTQLKVPSEIPLGEYLFLRISQANPKLRSIFGVAGDYSLNLLEHLYAESVQKQRGIDFVGLCNELNAAYAVNGYCLALGGLAVLITTFGVGELSAINGVAAGFSEFVPTLHIVGTSSRPQRAYAADASNPVKNFHHLVSNKNQLSPPNHNVYQEMSSHVSTVQEFLESADDRALDQIDHVLNEILRNSRPGYLFVPADLPDVKVSTSRLFEPVDFYGHQQAHAAVVDEIADAILHKLYAASTPAILSDFLISRFNLDAKLAQFVHQADPGQKFLRLFNTNMGRNLDESLPNFVGCYYGKISTPQVIDEMELRTDTLLVFGHANLETNTGSYTSDLSHIAHYVEINHDYVLIDGKHHLIKQESGERLFTLENLLDRMIARFDARHYAHTPLPVNVTYKYTPALAPQNSVQEYVSQNKLLHFVNEYLQPNDIVMFDINALFFGAADLVLPRGCKMIVGAFYASIGHTLPTAVGATFAVNDSEQARRIVVFEGDGSAQMTIQELSAFVRYNDVLKIKPQMFIMNNDGYTIERAIKGPTRSYNDIAPGWNWTGLLRTFGDEEGRAHTAEVVRNDTELDEFRARETDGKGNISSDKLAIIDLKMGKFDVLDKLVHFMAKAKK